MIQTHKYSGKILVIPGSNFQLPLVRKSKEMGFDVFCCDRSENAICKDEVTEFRNIGVNDIENLLEFTKEIQPNAIITDQTDTAVRTTAYLCQTLNLRGIGQDIAELYTNKMKMRMLGELHKLPTPKFKICKSTKDVEIFALDIGYPIILKPTSNQSSKGIYKVNCFEEIQELYKKSVSYSDNSQILAEEFIEGIEFTVEGYKSNLKHHTLAISQKSHYKDFPFVACQLLYTKDTKFNLELLKETNDKFVELSNLPFGITHAEYKFANNKFYLIEIAARGGGNRISSDLIPLISGVDIYRNLILDSLGYENLIDIPHHEYPKHGLLEFFIFSEGQVKNIIGIQEARKIKGVIEISVDLQSGDFVKSPSDDTKRPGFFMIVADTLNSLMVTRDQLLKTVKIEYL